MHAEYLSVYVYMDRGNRGTGCMRSKLYNLSHQKAYHIGTGCLGVYKKIHISLTHSHSQISSFCFVVVVSQ